MVIKNNNPLLLISNEANKELLVYEVISKWLFYYYILNLQKLTVLHFKFEYQ